MDETKSLLDMLDSFGDAIATERLERPALPGAFEVEEEVPPSALAIADSVPPVVVVPPRPAAPDFEPVRRVYPDKPPTFAGYVPERRTTAVFLAAFASQGRS